MDVFRVIPMAQVRNIMETNIQIRTRRSLDLMCPLAVP